MIQTGSRSPVISKMELYVTSFNGFQFFHKELYLAGILDPTFAADIFTSQS